MPDASPTDASIALAQEALFLQLLGADDFNALPGPVQRLHRQQGTRSYRGQVEVARGRSLLSRLCAWATRLPSAGTGPITVEITSDAGRERWTRHIGKHAMTSALWAGDGLLCERLGLVTFGFDVGRRDDSIGWVVRKVRLFGLLPLPASWFSGVGAREWAEGERYHFEVRAALPVAGPLVHYRGWLDVP